MTEELARENNLTVDIDGFNESIYKTSRKNQELLMPDHLKVALLIALMNQLNITTLAHLMLAALQQMYGPDIIQKGCNITSERIRFDF